MTLVISKESTANQGLTDRTPYVMLCDTIVPDSLQAETIPINVEAADSIIIQEDSILVSPSAINASIFYDATDSMVFDAVEQKVRLYNNAIVKYEEMTLTAAYIEYSFADNLACAEAVPDSAGVLTGVPKFDDGEQDFSQENLCYNFRTGRGYSQTVVTQDGDAYVHSAVAKRQANEWVHIKDGKFTTCSHENPHFHFHITKGIIIPGEKIVTGPVYMKVRKVPMPLALPFGFFPNKKESSHGLILPGYGNGNRLGYFLKGLGYYVPISDYFDTKMLFDIYSRGSWSARNVTNYKWKYRFFGNLDISRMVTKTGFEELPTFSKTTDFFVKWNHTQDNKARPNTTFGISLNAGTSTNFQNNLSSSQQDLVSNTFTSSINWSKSWAGKHNLTLQGRHSQNTLTENVDVLLPSLSYSRNRFDLPMAWLKRSPSAKKAWYEKIGVNFSATAENFLRANESDIRFNNMNSLLDQSSSGAKMTSSASTSLKAMRGFVTINPSVSYNEFWSFKYLTQSLDPATLEQVSDTLKGFRRAGVWRASVNASTRVYTTFFMKTKNVKAFRHVMTPNIGMSYDPFRDFRTYGFFGEGGTYSSYSEFDVARFRPSSRAESGAITFGLNNNLEMKVRDKSANKLAYKKVKLIDNLSVNGSYNLVADSLNLSTIRLRGFTKIGQKLDVTVNSVFNAYDRDSLGNEIDTYLIDSQGKLARMQNTTFTLNTRLRSNNKKDPEKEDRRDIEEDDLDMLNTNRAQFVDFNVPWSLNVRYNLSVNKRFDTALQADTNAVTQTVSMDGDFSIFEKWKVGFQTGYDFRAKQLTVTTLNLYWDLHCWELTATWIPIGPLKSYSLQLNVKSALLQDLKLQRRGNLGQNDVLY